MMLFNIKQCRWRSVARQEFEQCPESLLGAADRRRMTPPVCVHTLKTMCSNFKDMVRRNTALRFSFGVRPPSVSRFSNSCISAKYCPILTIHQWNAYLFIFQGMYKSQ